MEILIVELISFLGYVNNDTGIQGKSFIFKVIQQPIFECVLFIHPTQNPFVTIPDDIIDINIQQLLNSIFHFYPLSKLMSYEN